MGYKKIIAVITAVTLIASLTACGAESENTVPDVTTTAATEWTGDNTSR